MDERTHQILLALAWLGEATKVHLRDLCCAGMSEKTVQRALKSLLDGPEPLVIARPRHIHDGTAPKREAFVYALSEAGHKYLSNDAAYPRKTQRGQYPAKITNPADIKRLEHQLLATEAIVQLVVLARQRSLSGVFVAREMRLNRQRPEPVLDAVVMLHVSGEAPGGGGVPWTKDPPVAGERVWGFAIESDRATEAPAVIAAKASAYAAAEVDLRTRDDWRERTGQMLPLVLWVAPTAKRLEVIHRIWSQAWSAGSWLLATPQQLVSGTVWHYRNFERVELRLFAGSSPQYLGVRTAPASASPTSTAARPLHPDVSVAVAAPAINVSSRPRVNDGAVAPAHATASTQAPPPRVAAPAPASPAAPSRPRPQSRAEWAAFLAERVLLWPFVGVLIAFGWSLSRLGRGLWWLLRMLGRRVMALWSWLDDVSEGHPGMAALITLMALLVIVAPVTAPTWWPWVQRLTQSEAAAEAPLPTAAPLPLPPLLAATTAVTEPPHTCGQARVTARGVRLRPVAGTDNKPLATLAKGATVELLCSEVTLTDGSRWVQVHTQDGKEGWVRSDLVAGAKPP